MYTWLCMNDYYEWNKNNISHLVCNFKCFLHYKREPIVLTAQQFNFSATCFKRIYSFLKNMYYYCYLFNVTKTAYMFHLLSVLFFLGFCNNLCELIEKGFYWHSQDFIATYITKKHITYYANNFLRLYSNRYSLQRKQFIANKL